jgi:hypothetical protein
MAWTTISVAVANTPATANAYNALLANLQETAAAKATTAGSLFVGTGLHALAERIPDEIVEFASESINSLTYTNLTTIGPALTRTTGNSALVGITSDIGNNTIGSVTYASFRVSGATTIAADDNYALAGKVEASAGGPATLRASAFRLIKSLTPGSNTFTMMYRTSSGVGTWNERSILVIPL